MSLKAKANDPILVKTLSNIKLLDDEPVINITREGIQIKGLNKSHTLFHNIKLDKHLFISYGVDEELKVAVDSQKLSQIMNKIKGDEMELQITEEQIMIIARGENTRTFKLGAIIPEYADNTKMPVIETDNTLQIPATAIKQAVEDAKILDNKMNKLTFNYNADEDVLTISSTNELADSEIQVQTRDIEAVRKDATSPRCEAVFSSEYIESIMKFETNHDQWTVGLGDCQPIVFEADNMTFILAPIIEAE